MFLCVVSIILLKFYGSCKMSHEFFKACLAANRSLGLFLSILLSRLFASVDRSVQFLPK